MRGMMLGFVILPFLAGVAVAGERLNDAQMDRISAGTASGFDPTGLAFTDWQPSITAGDAKTESACAGCTSQTSGTVFMPSSTQTLFSNLENFLLQQPNYPR